MANKQKQETRRAAKQSPANSPLTIILVGLVCLAVGLGIGYYFGVQGARTSAPTAPTPEDPSSAPGQAPLASPADFTRIEAGLKAALSANPKEFGVLVQLGNLYYDNGRFREAVDWYGRALEIDAKNPNVRTDRGTSYWNLGQADEAITEFKKALEVDPIHPQTLYNLGVVYLHGKNNPAEAKKAWEKLLAANPNYPERARIQEQLASLSAPPSTPPVPAGKSKAAPEGMEELLQRMAKRP